MRMARLVQRGVLVTALAALATQGCHAQTQVKIGRCDVAVLPDSAWLEMEKLGVRAMRSQETPMQTWPLYHYVHKSNTAIIPLLTQALQDMQKSGYLAQKPADFNRRLQQVRRNLSGV